MGLQLWWVLIMDSSGPGVGGSIGGNSCPCGLGCTPATGTEVLPFDGESLVLIRTAAGAPSLDFFDGHHPLKTYAKSRAVCLAVIEWDIGGVVPYGIGSAV